jgi:hypothetical protein
LELELFLFSRNDTFCQPTAFYYFLLSVETALSACLRDGVCDIRHGGLLMQQRTGGGSARSACPIRALPTDSTDK